MILRDYQQRVVCELEQAARNRPLLVLPTGAGKTVIACELIERFSGTVVFLTHRRELVFQARDRLKQHGIEAGIVMGSEDREEARVQVASVQTLARRECQGDLLIVDEAHHANADSWRSVISRYPMVIGMTATPYRLDGSPLGDVFGSMVVGPSVKELVERGVLIEPIVYAPPGPDMTGIRVRAGEFEHGALTLRVDTPQLTGDIVAHWKKFGGGMKTIVFACGVEHSLHIQRAFMDAGVLAAHVDGSYEKERREDAFSALAGGDIEVLTNCDLVGEGWDLPALECAILARPTASMGLHRQQIGRIMRACKDKQGALVLDHAGNSHRHGLVTDEIEFSLHAKAVKKSPAPPACRECFAVMPGGYPCPQCGYEPDPEQIRREIATKEGELVKFESKEARSEWYKGVVATANGRGYKLGWAKRQFKERYGVWPRGLKDVEEAYVCIRHEPERREYGVVCGRCLRPVRSV